MASRTSTPRHKSKLTLAGEEAQRTLLRATLAEHEWHLTRTALALDMGAPSAVIRSIKALGMENEYNAARARRDVRPGPRPPAEPDWPGGALRFPSVGLRRLDRDLADSKSLLSDGIACITKT